MLRAYIDFIVINMDTIYPSTYILRTLLIVGWLESWEMSIWVAVPLIGGQFSIA